MKSLVSFILHTYALLLHLYPSGFKDEFAGEMYTVFQDSVVSAAREGIAALTRVYMHELVNLPASILREFWYEIRGKEVKLQVAQEMPGGQQSGAWSDALWAGMPHLLIAAVAGLGGLVAGTKMAALPAIAVVFLLLAGFGATIYYTWRKHWPAWTASWYGYVGLIILLFGILPRQGWIPPAEGIFLAIGLILLPLCLTALLYWLTRRNPIEALLMAMPVIIIYWFPVMEFIPNQIRNWLTFGIFFLSALTAFTISRINNIRAAIWIVLGASILAGLPISYARTYWQEIPFPYTPTVGQMAELFSVQWLASSALVLGPILGWGIWNLGKGSGQNGRLAASLIILGTLVNLWGQFRYWQWYSHQNFFDAFGFRILQLHGQVGPALTIYAAMTTTWVGAILLARSTWVASKPLSLCLIILPLALPVLAMFPIYFGYHIVPAGLSFEFAELSEKYQLLILLMGVLLLVASGWAGTRLYSDRHQTSTA